MFDTFTLMSNRKGIIKDSYQLTAEFHLGGSHANFSIGPVTPEHAGIYTCYGSFHETPYEWSESSDPIDINITGLYKKPSLSALMCPVVMSGENMTLSCTSDHQFEMFHLSREGVPQGHGLPAVKSHSGISKAIFLLDPVIKKGTYRCYGSFRNFSHVWSSPSDPLYIPVTVNSSRNCTLSREPDSKTNNHRIMHMLIGLSVTMILVFSVILLYACCSTKRSKSQNKANECHLSSVRKQNQRNTANLNEESEMRTILNRQDPERQEVLEVEYLEFEPMIFKQQLTTSISQIPKEFSTDPSVYMDCPKRQSNAIFAMFHMQGALKWLKNYMSASNVSLNVETCAGINAKPSLSAWPSHVVPRGQNVTLTCDTHDKFNTVMFYKEHEDPQLQVYKRTVQRSLVLGPVTPESGGTYRCYSYKGQYHNELSSPSEPLKIIISGIYRKPFLLALPTPLVKLGEKATLKCLSEIMFDTFTLTSHRMGVIKNSYQLSAEAHHGGSRANFPIGPVTTDHTGTYTCYGSYKQIPYEWSESSDPVDIKITGLYKKPSLSALRQPEMTSGENMILSCTSDQQFDLFHLSIKGVPLGHGLPAEQSHSGTFKANFLPVPLIQAETYRCYGSFRNSSHVWSSPSDPLFLSVSDNHIIMHMSIGLSVTMILVFFVILLYACCSAKKRILKRSQKETSKEPEKLNLEENRYVIFIDLGQERATEEHERKEMLEVTYTEFEQWTFKQLTMPNTEQPQEFCKEISVYMVVMKQ
ncbi:killer cell immunoglobulin-like receptor 3DL1 [Microtus pennsylvanicus]|uniref:killer cell immunoglobulin-like receptor 3DL1 n=1 Tax=Microtus pennsylvanicus TaxID=10058 RepID=UPI003F6C3762